MVAVVEDNLEVKGGGQGSLGARLGPAREVRRRVPVANSLEVALHATLGVGSVSLVGLREVDSRRVLRDVLVNGDVALVVERTADEVREDAERVARGRDAALGIDAVEGGYVVARDAAPVALGRVHHHPSFDAREQALRAGPVGVDVIGDAVDDTPGPDTRTGRVEDGDQVLGAGENEDVGLVGVEVPRQALVRLAGYGRDAQVPA